MGQPKHDQGYSWVILVAAFWSQTIQIGVVFSSGIFYVLFMENIKTSSKSTLALISGSNLAVFFLTAPISAYLSKRFGYRIVHMIGGLLAFIGLVWSAFSSHVVSLFISFTFITGFGFGLCFITSLGIVGIYFEKRRSLALGLAVSGAGFGTLIAPPIIRGLVYFYGYQGALLLIAAISLHLLLFGVVFKPFERTKEPNAKSQTDNKVGKSKFQTLLDCHLFCDPVFIMLCVDNMSALLALSVIYVHFAAYAQSLGFQADMSAILYSGIGISNFGARLIYSFLGLSPKIKPLVCHNVGRFFAAVCTVICPFTKEYFMLMIYAVCIGIAIALQAICLPTFLADYFSPDKLPTSFGYLLVFQAVGQSIGGPLASFLYSCTGLYQSSLFLAGSCLAFSGLILIYPSIKTFRRQTEILEATYNTENQSIDA